MQKDPMLDSEFLRQLDLYPHKFLWAKVIALDRAEYPLDEIQGRITSGNVSIDGTSTVRRTCSISMVLDQDSIQDFYWGLKTKFKFYVGVENYIDKNYPDIIWFNEGTFVITSFSSEVGINSCSVNLQGKDKMVLLNGDLGGVIPSSWDFGTETVNVTDEKGNTVYDSTGYAITETRQIPIKDIILQAVHEYTQEPWQNIIVNDLDDYGIELLEYKGSTPLYYLIAYGKSGDNNSREVENMTLDSNMACEERMDTWVDGHRVEGQWEATTLKNIERNGLSYEKLMEQLDPSGAVTESSDYLRAIVRFKDDPSNLYTVAKITSNNGMQVCGYRICDIVYPYDLIASPGDTITSVLDKLVNMLGNFEYYYDVNGRFIFQRKRTYSDVSYNNIHYEHSINDEVWADSSNLNSRYSYIFDENILVSSIQNSPNLSNLKNDFSLWGARQSSNGNTTVPIHMRYAIDHKPMWYKAIGWEYDYDDQGNPKKDKTGKYVYKNANKIYVTEEGWQNYCDHIGIYKQEGINFDVDAYRENYPEGFNDPNSELYNWWKLKDWGALYEHFVGEIPKNVFMGYGAVTILDKNYRGTIGILGKGLGYDDYQDIGFASKTDVAEVVYEGHTNNIKRLLGHGFCTRYYNATNNERSLVYIEDSTADSEERHVIWVYDPRWHGAKSTESSSILNNSMLGKYEESEVTKVDWREIIFQMANDYRRHYRDNDFLLKVSDNNRYIRTAATNEGKRVVRGYDSWYPTGITGYEKYYVDFEMNASQHVVAYWRELYNPDAKGQSGNYDEKGRFITNDNVLNWNKMDNGYSKGAIVKYNGILYKSLKNLNRDTPGDSSASWAEAYFEYTYNSDGWNVNILNNPEQLNFWFDFLDSTGELNKYSVNNIGLRSKAANDDKIKSIYFRETPNVIFDVEGKTTQREKWTKPGYCYINIPKGLDNLFTISTRGKDAMDVIEDYLYSYTYPATSITLSTVPIYYLVPNTLIYVNDKITGIAGEYILQKYSIQLGSSSSMSLTAVETPKRIY